jgi:hypothetical protein
MLWPIDQSTIDRAARDLSNGVRFTHKRWCGVIYRSIHITVACRQDFEDFEFFLLF